MKRLVFLFIALYGLMFASISSCQTQNEISEVEQMEQVIKKQPELKKRTNYFDSCRKLKQCFYYVVDPNPKKIELVNQDKAAIQADYPVEFRRVKSPSEANKIVN